MKLLMLALLSAFPFTAIAKGRAPAADGVPKCWKVYDPKIYDGLYHITIPATDAITAKEVAAMIFALQGFGVKEHTVMAIGDKIQLEAQFVSLSEGRALGYPTQEKLEELVDFVMKDEVPFLDKGVTITCFAQTPPRHH